MRAIAIGLKIPDNAAYTARVALRRLGVDVERVERSEIWFFDESDDTVLVRRIVDDETIFNPNKHRLALLDQSVPRSGEVWIEPLSPASRGPAAVAWRLFDANGEPVARVILDAAIERLLCNPAIDRAVTEGDGSDRDIPIGSE
ncbi:MAG: hypothetical protein WAK84_08675 [Candidatus Cybelea sp.]